MFNLRNHRTMHSDVNHSDDRLTATEIIDGVEHLLILERDGVGSYQEVISKPLVHVLTPDADIRQTNRRAE